MTSSIRVPILLLVGALCSCLIQSPSARAQQCDDFNECTGVGVCGADDICKDGQPVPDGTSCDAPSAGSCLQNPTCVDGSCSGGDAMPNGTPCRILNSPCFTQGSCLGPPIPIPGLPVVCFGSLPITCPDDGNPLTAEFCNPESGHCESSNTCVSGACVQRRVQGAACVETPRNNGAPCDDFNDCTASTVCSDGICTTFTGPSVSDALIPTDVSWEPGGRVGTSIVSYNWPSCDLTAVDLDLTFGGPYGTESVSLAQVQSVDLAPQGQAAGCTVVPNTAIPGRLQVSVACVDPLPCTGKLLDINFGTTNPYGNGPSCFWDRIQVEYCRMNEQPCTRL